jgi:DNA-binding XRE family transcriptional regulator
VTRQTVIANEQGKYSPSLEMAFQIARIFEVPLEEVFHNPDGVINGGAMAVTANRNASQAGHSRAARGTRS